MRTMTGEHREIEGRELVAVPVDLKNDATLKFWLDAIAKQTRQDLQRLRGDVSRDRLVEWAESAPGELGTIGRAYVAKLDDHERLVRAIEDRDQLIDTLNRQCSDLSAMLEKATKLYKDATEYALALKEQQSKVAEVAKGMKVETPFKVAGPPVTAVPSDAVRVQTKPQGFVAGVLDMFGAALDGYIDTWRKHPMEMGATHVAFFALRSMAKDRDEAWAEYDDEAEAHMQTMAYYEAEGERREYEFMQELAERTNGELGMVRQIEDEADRADRAERERDEARLQLGAKPEPVEVHVHNEIPQQSETDRQLAADIAKDEATDSTREMYLEIDQEAVRDALKAEARAEMRANPKAYRGPRGPQGKTGKAGTTKTIRTVVHKQAPTPKSEAKPHGGGTHTRELITLRPTMPRGEMTEATRRMVERTRQPKGDA